MKHLRRFNEDLTQDELRDLKEFCESCLAYLLDEGFEIDYEKGTGDFHWIDLWGSKDEEYDNPISYTWDQVKDYYIPFIQLLKSRYKLVDSIIYVKIGAGQDFATSFEQYTFDEVLNDEVYYTGKIYSLSIKVSEKL
jgi:hypothetical protein